MWTMISRISLYTLAVFVKVFLFAYSVPVNSAQNERNQEWMFFLNKLVVDIEKKKKKKQVLFIHFWWNPVYNNKKLH